MKKLLCTLTIFLFAVAANAQQTEDQVYIGRGKTFGSFKGNGIIIPETDKPVNGPTTITGIVTGVGADSLVGKRGCFYSFYVKKSDGTTVIIGTKDYGFTVPKGLVGKNILIESIDPGKVRERRPMQKGIQLAATGIKVTD